MMSFTPLVSSHVYNVLAKIAPELSQLNQLLFQFINAVDVSMVKHSCIVAYI